MIANEINFFTFLPVYRGRAVRTETSLYHAHFLILSKCLSAKKCKDINSPSTTGFVQRLRCIGNLGCQQKVEMIDWPVLVGQDVMDTWRV